MWNVLQNSSTSFLHLRYSSRHSLSIVELFTCISKSFFNSSILLFWVNNYFTIKLSTIEKNHVELLWWIEQIYQDNFSWSPRAFTYHFIMLNFKSDVFPNHTLLCSMHTFQLIYENNSSKIIIRGYSKIFFFNIY